MSVYVEYSFNTVSMLRQWPRGLMVKALVFGTKDCAFESHRGRNDLFCFWSSSALSFSLHASG